MLNIATYRAHIKTFVRYSDNRSLAYLTKGLLSEIGEVIGVLAKADRGDYDAETHNQRLYEWERLHKALLKEMGDVWFMIGTEGQPEC